MVFRMGTGPTIMKKVSSGRPAAIETANAKAYGKLGMRMASYNDKAPLATTRKRVNGSPIIPTGKPRTTAISTKER